MIKKFPEGIDAKPLGLSADSLERIAKLYLATANDLRASQPSYLLALRAGVRDVSYVTHNWGEISSYSGEGVVVMEDGKRWRCVGHRAQGTPDYVRKGGWIEFIPL